MNILKRCLIIFPWKALTQCLHLYGFSSECIFKCHLRSDIGEKAFVHYLHLYGFSPNVYFQKPYKINIALAWFFPSLSPHMHIKNTLKHSNKFGVHCNSTQDIRKYLWIRDIVTSIKLKTIFCSIFHIFLHFSIVTAWYHLSVI